MSTGLRIVLVVSLLLGCAWSQQVTFRTSPEGAAVYTDTGQFLGYAGKPIEVPLRPCTLSFSLKDHETVVREFGVGTWSTTYPLKNSEPLKLGLSPQARKRRVLRVGLIVALLGLTSATAIWRRRRARSSMADLSLAGFPLVGKRLHDYRVLGLLGKGGMAKVYRAVRADESKSSDEVALKVLSEDFVEEPEYLARFRREIRILSQLDHPNIVRVYDWGEVPDSGAPYLTMELVNGQELKDAVTGALKPEEALTLFWPVLQAVCHAHSRGVTHRDLKPSNIMVTKEGVAKVMDFGLAKREDSSVLTRTGACLGTPAYMAPEQIKGEPYEPSVDQYTLGVIAFELLTGRRPFIEEEPIQLIFAHLQSPPPNPREFNPTLSDELSGVLLKMLAKDSEGRFPTLNDAAAALRQAVFGTPPN